MLATNDVLWLSATLVSVPLLESPVAVLVAAVGECGGSGRRRGHLQEELLRVAVH
jgi:hypothetical protein